MLKSVMVFVTQFRLGDVGWWYVWCSFNRSVYTRWCLQY